MLTEWELDGLTKSNFDANVDAFCETLQFEVGAQSKPTIESSFAIETQKKSVQLLVEVLFIVRSEQQVRAAIDGPTNLQRFSEIFSSLFNVSISVSVSVLDSSKAESQASSNLPTIIGASVGVGASFTMVALVIFVIRRNKTRATRSRRQTADAQKKTEGRVFVDKEFFDNKPLDTMYKDTRSSTTHVPLEDIVARSDEESEAHARAKQDSFRQVIRALHAHSEAESISSPMYGKPPTSPASVSNMTVSEMFVPKLRDQLNNTGPSQGIRISNDFARVPSKPTSDMDEPIDSNAPWMGRKGDKS